jgi:hypothetical protein
MTAAAAAGIVLMNLLQGTAVHKTLSTASGLIAFIICLTTFYQIYKMVTVDIVFLRTENKMLVAYR